MATAKQELGTFGEKLVERNCSCPSCKRHGTLVRLRQNFKCADVVCDFCGYLAQVKTTTKANINDIPTKVLGAAWKPQQERMKAGIYFPLFLVLATKDRREYAIYYLSADLQKPDIFKPRKPLSPRAKRAGWQGFYYLLEPVRSYFVRLF